MAEVLMRLRRAAAAQDVDSYLALRWEFLPGIPDRTSRAGRPSVGGRRSSTRMNEVEVGPEPLRRKKVLIVPPSLRKHAHREVKVLPVTERTVDAARD
jgi:hypothetical protein